MWVSVVCGVGECMCVLCVRMGVVCVVYVGICVWCVFMCDAWCGVGECACVCVRESERERERQHLVLPHFCTVFLKQGLSLNLERAILARVAVKRAPWDPLASTTHAHSIYLLNRAVFRCLALGSQKWATMPGFYVDAGHLNSSLHACTTPNFPHGAVPSPCNLI